MVIASLRLMWACVERSFSQVVFGLPVGLVSCMRTDNGNDNEPSVMTPTLAKISWLFFLLLLLLLLLHLFPLLCGVDVSYETPPSRPVLRVLL